MDQKIVAIGFLTADDLGVLGEGFRRRIPVPDDDSFASLIARLDELSVSYDNNDAGHLNRPGFAGGSNS